MFGWLRNRRRRRILAEPIPDTWLSILERRVPFFSEYDANLRDQFLADLRVFIAEKHWIPAAGMEIDDEVRVVIAAAAVRLSLHLGVDVYNRLTEIVIYPHHYHHSSDEGGYGDGSVVFGEAHDWGTVVLSWPAVVSGIGNRRDGHDTAAHEFAHVLDRADGAFDGTPELRARADYRPWARVMSRHFLGLRRGKRAQRRLLRDYGAINESEFFAVATETYFENPAKMKRAAPDLYEELDRYYAGSRRR